MESVNIWEKRYIGGKRYRGKRYRGKRCKEKYNKTICDQSN